MTDASFVPLTGSERAPLAEFEPVGPLDGTERIEITLLTRRMAELPRTAAGTPARISRDDLRQQFGSDPADQALVAEILASPGAGIEVVSRDPAARRMVLSGTVNALSEVFGTDLSLVTSQGPSGTVTHRYRTGGLQIPAELDGIVVAVLGLDDRPQARPQIRYASRGRAAAVVLHPARRSPRPTSSRPGTDGTGQTIAIIELGGGFGQSDLDSYFGGLGIAAPSVTAVERGRRPATSPGQDPQGADGEVLLDIEVAGVGGAGRRPSWSTSRPTPTRASSTR